MLFMLMKFQVTPDDLLSNAQVLNYADKDSQSPTSIVLNKDYLKDLFFNQTPAKVSLLCNIYSAWVFTFSVWRMLLHGLT